jgi:hypothetical protein
LIETKRATWVRIQGLGKLTGMAAVFIDSYLTQRFRVAEYTFLICKEEFITFFAETVHKISLSSGIQFFLTVDVRTSNPTQGIHNFIEVANGRKHASFQILF